MSSHPPEQPVLYIVPTPVGNLEDITLRALRILKEVSLILAEDTRTSSVLLKHYDIHTPLRSHHKFNEHKTSDELAERIAQGMKVALISDAGTPCISDPGFMLVRACVQKGVEVQCLPGATAFVPALVNSALPSDRFYFEGFLPQKKGRQTRLQYIAELQHTIILYESPFRLLKTLEQLAVALGSDRQASVSREISKLHEQTCRGTIAELIEHYKQTPPKGEIVLCIAGKEQ